MVGRTKETWKIVSWNQKADGARRFIWRAWENRAVFIRLEGHLARIGGTAGYRKDGPLSGGAVKRL